MLYIGFGSTELQYTGMKKSTGNLELPTIKDFLWYLIPGEPLNYPEGLGVTRPISVRKTDKTIAKT